jgi:hypothetical protein
VQKKLPVKNLKIRQRLLKFTKRNSIKKCNSQNLNKKKKAMKFSTREAMYF